MRTRVATSAPPFCDVAQTVTRRPGSRAALVALPRRPRDRGVGGERHHQRLLRVFCVWPPRTMLAVRRRRSEALSPRTLHVSTPVMRSLPGAAGAVRVAAGRRRALASTS